MKARSLTAFLAVVAMLATVACNKQEGPVREAVSHKDDYQLAYIYGFPMIAGYKAMYQFAIDKTVLATTNPNREARQQEDVMNYKTLITSVARGTGRRLVRSDLNRYTEGGDAGWRRPQPSARPDTFC